MSVRIMCDTTCDLSAAQAEEFGITLIPVKVFFAEGDFLDGTQLSNADFFQKMRENSRLPITSQITPEEFRQAFSHALEESDEVVLLTLSSKLSGTYDAAVRAREGMMEAERDRIFLCDSLLTSFALALLVREASDMARKGMSGAEIVADLDELRLRTKLEAVVGSLDNLKKGGRLPLAVAWVGNVLGIKPAVTMRDGKAVLSGKVRGSRKKVVSWLIERAEKEGADLISQPLAIAYAEDFEDAKELISALAQKSVSSLHLLVVQIGAAMATHIGDKGVGISYICPPGQA